MRRTHERVLAEGTFRLVLTERHRLVAAIDADTALGPLHVAVNVDTALDAHRRELAERLLHRQRHPHHHEVGFSLPSISIPNPVKEVAHAAESAFKTASKIVPAVAAPALSIVQQAALHGANLSSFLPSDVRPHLEAATRVMARAKLGDVGAKQFIGKVVSAAKDNVPGASTVADKLLDANRFLDRTLQTVQRVQDDVTNPARKAQDLLSAIQKGDWHSVRLLAHREVSNVEGALSMLPGIGNAAAASIAAGVAALEGGSPIEVAVRTVYGTLPIPPGIRSITDAALDAVLELVVHRGSLTEAAIAATRASLPDGAREVFDVLMTLVRQRIPNGHEALEHYVRHYAGDALRAFATPPSAFAHA